MFDTKVVVYDVDTEETIQIKQNRFYIGRGEDCAIRIKNHMVGMRHALVFSDNGLWYIISFSLCGTWLNDVKLDPTKVYLIHEKEIIDIGHVKRLMIQGTRDDLYQNEVDERSSSDIHRRCLKCMKEFRIPKGCEKENCVCPHCGFVEGTNPNDLCLLFPGVMLHGRYEIGAYAYSAGSENRYLAWDHLEKRIVQIQELFLSGSTMRIPGKPEAIIIEFRKNDFNSELERFLLYSEEFLRFERCDSIIQVTDVFCENNIAYRVKDYVGGVPLNIYLKEKCVLSVDEAITLICSVLNALKVIHKNEMLHSELNPHNIILSGEKAVVEVVDCGTAFHYLKNRSKHTRSTIFTPGYASPELYTCRAERLGSWVDIYAVAALLFQMLTGTKPDECTDRMVEKDSVEEVLDRVQTIPKELKNVIMMGMELDYKKRFQTAESFHDAVLGKIRVEKKRNVLGRLSWKCYTV